MNTRNNTAVRYVNSAKFPIRFDKLRPGSLFKIAGEPSRGIKESKDGRIYRKAHEHEGFHAYVEGNKAHGVVLYPFDMVQPVRKEKV